MRRTMLSILATMAIVITGGFVAPHHAKAGPYFGMSIGSPGYPYGYPNPAPYAAAYASPYAAPYANPYAYPYAVPVQPQLSLYGGIGPLAGPGYGLPAYPWGGYYGGYYHRPAGGHYGYGNGHMHAHGRW